MLNDIKEKKMNNKELNDNNSEDLNSKDLNLKDLNSKDLNSKDSHLSSPNQLNLEVPNNTPSNNNLNNILNIEMVNEEIEAQILNYDDGLENNNIRNQNINIQRPLNINYMLLRQQHIPTSNKFSLFKKYIRTVDFKQTYCNFKNFISRNYLKICMSIYLTFTLYKYCDFTYKEGINSLLCAYKDKSKSFVNFEATNNNVFNVCNSNKEKRFGLSLIYPIYYIFDKTTEYLAWKITQNIMQK